MLFEFVYYLIFYLISYIKFNIQCFILILIALLLFSAQVWFCHCLAILFHSSLISVLQCFFLNIWIIQYLCLTQIYSEVFLDVPDYPVTISEMVQPRTVIQGRVLLLHVVLFSWHLSLDCMMPTNSLLMFKNWRQVLFTLFFHASRLFHRQGWLNVLFLKGSNFIYWLNIYQVFFLNMCSFNMLGATVVLVLCGWGSWASSGIRASMQGPRPVLFISTHQPYVTTAQGIWQARLQESGTHFWR